MAKSFIKKDACMKCYDKLSQCTDPHAFGVGLGVALLQTRNVTSFPRDEAPDSSIHRPTAFVSTGLSSM